MALKDSPARRPGAGRKARSETSIILRLKGLDREFIRVERPQVGHDGRRRAGVRGRSIEPRQCDVLLVDRHENLAVGVSEAFRTPGRLRG